MLKLQAAIKYGDEDLAGAKSLVDQCPPDDPDTDINRGLPISKETLLLFLSSLSRKSQNFLSKNSGKICRKRHISTDVGQRSMINTSG